MSDVLSAEEVEGFVRRVEARYIDFDAFAALARSHEQLRAERDAARETVQNMGEWLEESEAAARAGGCAADLAEALREIADNEFVRSDTWEGDYRWCRQRARVALSAYDRAVSGLIVEPLATGLPVDDEKVAREIRDRARAHGSYFPDVSGQTAEKEEA